MSKIAEAWELLEIALSWQENENEKLNVFLSATHTHPHTAEGGGESAHGDTPCEK